MKKILPAFIIFAIAFASPVVLAQTTPKERLTTPVELELQTAIEMQREGRELATRQIREMEEQNRLSAQRMEAAVRQAEENFRIANNNYAQAQRRPGFFGWLNFGEQRRKAAAARAWQARAAQLRREWNAEIARQQRKAADIRLQEKNAQEKSMDAIQKGMERWRELGR